MEKFDLRKTYMSDRGVFDYMKKLEISEQELDDPKALILDLGSGTEQNFAKEIRELGLKSKVLSIDPRLGLDKEEDLKLPLSSKKERITGRQKPEPGTLAALGGSLPLKDESMDKIFAMYSVPYYLEKPEEINQNLSEMIRVLKSGGIIKAFPVFKEQLPHIKDFLDKQKNIRYSCTLKEADGGKGGGEIEDWFLVIEKK